MSKMREAIKALEHALFTMLTLPLLMKCLSQLGRRKTAVSH